MNNNRILDGYNNYVLYMGKPEISNRELYNTIMNKGKREYEVRDKWSVTTVVNNDYKAYPY